MENGKWAKEESGNGVWGMVRAREREINNGKWAYAKTCTQILKQNTAQSYKHTHREKMCVTRKSEDNWNYYIIWHQLPMLLRYALEQQRNTLYAHYTHTDTESSRLITICIIVAPKIWIHCFTFIINSIFAKLECDPHTQRTWHMSCQSNWCHFIWTHPHSTPVPFYHSNTTNAKSSAFVGRHFLPWGVKIILRLHVYSVHAR